jgi:hypothetical protein
MWAASRRGRDPGLRSIETADKLVWSFDKLGLDLRRPLSVIETNRLQEGEFVLVSLRMASQFLVIRIGTFDVSCGVKIIGQRHLPSDSVSSGSRHIDVPGFSSFLKRTASQLPRSPRQALGCEWLDNTSELNIFIMDG